MSIKIQINSKEALERLIGGDNALEIDLRNQIVQDFAKKHLKAIAESAVHKAAVLDLKRDIKYAVKSVVDSTIFATCNSDINVYPESLTPEIKSRIQEETVSACNSIINAKLKELVSAKIDKYTPEYIASVVDRRIEERIQTVVDRKVNDHIAAIRKAL